jgi:hypothetical protein
MRNVNLEIVLIFDKLMCLFCDMLTFVLTFTVIDNFKKFAFQMTSSQAFVISQKNIYKIQFKFEILAIILK